jgi:DNA polymerase I-like protein with 3'-5' exonuclease and polymerase domains
MPYIDSAELGPASSSRQAYNALDCCLTYEVFERLCQIHGDPEAHLIYRFERGLQAPLLEMMLRGFLVDETERRRAAAAYVAHIGKLQQLLDRFATAIWGKGLNTASPKQLKDLLYGVMQLPPQYKFDKGEKKISANKDALEKLQIYLHAGPICRLVLRIRELSKELEVIEREVDPDGRMRTSFNMATETGRLSSSKSALGTGGNMQNIKRDERNDTDEDKFGVRRIFVADPGKIIIGVDLEQAESREVGWLHWTLLNDSKYLDAVYSGDIHTSVCRMVWPGLPWTGDLRKDKAIAEQRYYRNFTYRDMSKVCGHATNYYATPFTIAKANKIPQKLAEDFQQAYALGPQAAFPAFNDWWKLVASELQTKRSLTTVFGRRRQFFGRPSDDSTLREAIAFCPQSATADRMNLGMWRVWQHFGNRVQLLLQVHDAIYLQADQDDDLAAIVAKVLELIDIRLHYAGKQLIVPGEAKTGWNLSNYDARFNPNGLAKWKGVEKRTRLTGLDRVL